MAFKVFTNGSTLQASEVNDNLMRQAVSTFSNAAARTAAITAPSEGMLTYLEDVDRYEWWSGSAWRSPFGSTLVGSAIFTTQSSVSLNNVFTSAYRSYEVYLSYTGSANAGIRFRFRASGTDTSTSYNWGRLVVYNTSVIAANAMNDTSYNFGSIRNVSRRNFARLTLSNPAITGLTKNILSQSYDQDGGNTQSIWGSGILDLTAVYDGMTIFPESGTMTGELFVYGIRN